VEVSGQLHALTTLPLRKETKSTQWIGSWVDPRAGLDKVTKREIPSLPLPGTEFQSSKP